MGWDFWIALQAALGSISLPSCLLLCFMEHHVEGEALGEAGPAEGHAWHCCNGALLFLSEQQNTFTTLCRRALHVCEGGAEGQEPNSQLVLVLT